MRETAGGREQLGRYDQRYRERHRDVISSRQRARRARYKYPQYDAARQGTEQVKARAVLNRAVVAGKIVRPSCCCRCGQVSAVQGHHADYTKPFEVS